MSPNDDPQHHAPSSWLGLLASELNGVVMIVGAPDTGKTTLARFLYSHLAGQGRGKVAYLDADPGQSSLGPPTTISLRLSEDDGEPFPPQGRTWHWFVGSTSPSGHMLPHLTGLVRLTRAAFEHQAETVIVDTCGLVEPRRGGHVLKTAEIDLLRPAYLLALQREAELEDFLEPQRKAAKVTVREMETPGGVRRRSSEMRADNRARRYRQHFQPRHRHRIDPADWPVFPPGPIDSGRLAGLCDADGFALALAVAEKGNEDEGVTLTTPLESLEAVITLRLGDVLLDLGTFRDRLEMLRLR